MNLKKNYLTVDEIKTIIDECINRDYDCDGTKSAIREMFKIVMVARYCFDYNIENVELTGEVAQKEYEYLCKENIYDKIYEINNIDALESCIRYEQSIEKSVGDFLAHLSNKIDTFKIDDFSNTMKDVIKSIEKSNK